MTVPAFTRVVYLVARLSIRCLALIGVASLLLVGGPLPAFGQLVRLEETTQVGGLAVTLAYDPVDHAFLVGTSADPAYTNLLLTHAVFVDTHGTEMSRVMFDFPFYETWWGWGSTSYSADLSDGAGGRGAFLVVTNGRTQVVAYPGRVVSRAIFPDLPYTWPRVQDVAYSPTSHQFLAVVSALPPDCFQMIEFCSKVLALRLGLDGQLIGAPLELCYGCDGARVAWNATSNEFGVAYAGRRTGWKFARLSDTGSLIGAAQQLDATVVLPHSLGLAVNEATGHYVAVWSRVWCCEAGTSVRRLAVLGAEIDGAGVVVAAGSISDNLGLSSSLDLAYNPASGTFLLTGTSRTDPPRPAAIELNGRGAPHSTLTYVAEVGLPNVDFPWWQRVASQTDASAWLIAFAKSDSRHTSDVPTYMQIVGTSTRNGGSNWPLGVVCATPDPFEAIGGGQCVNGGWRPIEHAAFSPFTSGGCPRPDPFVSLGGGTCVNGGWLPPGMPPPLVPPSGCSTPDPFVALGGGTCYNGGWYPPGYPLPPTGSPDGTATCASPQPGATWVCVNGGWLPPDHPQSGGSSGGTAPCTSPRPGATWVCVNGGWVPPDHPLARGGGN